MEIKTFGIVGAGQMGNGIAQVAAQKGYSVIMTDVSMEIAEKGKNIAAKNLGRMVKKEKISEADKQGTLERIQLADNNDAVAGADIIVEAVTEDEQLKLDIFAHLDEITKSDVVLATNTSSISITKIAAATKRASKVIGMHFMNPVPMMKLVEVINGLDTDKETLDLTVQLCEKLGKTPVQANDFPGFVANRLLMPMINEATYCLMEGVGEAEAIDDVMKLGMAHPMGPLALADLIGLDTCLAIMETLHGVLGDAKYRPCPLMRKYVDAGRLGRKSGRGFYDYSK